MRQRRSNKKDTDSSTGVSTSSPASSDNTMASPHFFKNKFVKRGFVVHASPTHCLDTLWSWNNETLNTYTAVAGVLACGYFWLRLVGGYSDDDVAHAVADGEEAVEHGEDARLVLTLMLLFYVCNLLATAAYHLWCSHPPLYHFMSAVDLVGISFPALSVAAALACDERVVPAWLAHHPPYILLSVVTFVIAILMVVIFVVRKDLGRESPLWLLFVNALPFFVLMPAYFFSRFPDPIPTCAVTLLVSGLVLYVSKFPERSFPNRFDVVAQSHQLWHTAYIICFMLVYLDTCVLLSSTTYNRLHRMGFWGNVGPV